MNKICLFGIFLGFSTGIISCTTDKRLNTEAVREEIKSREVKKVTEAEIVNKVYEIGNEIALNTKKTLGKNLQESLQQGGVQNAISFCNLNAMPLVDSLSKKYGAVIRRTTLKARNPNDLPSDIEQKIMEAYEYQFKDSIPLKENVQPLENDQYLFTKAIFVENVLCLTCHGSTNNGLTLETEEFIKSKYPLDKATGYQVGDLRGMWSITIDKKKVVQSM